MPLNPTASKNAVTLCCTFLWLITFLHIISVCTGAPPAYTSSVGYPVMMQHPQPLQPLTSQTGHYSSPAAPSYVGDSGDVMPPTKI